MLGIVCYHYLSSYMEVNEFFPLGLFIIYLILWKVDSLRFSPVMSVLALVILFSFGFLRLQDHRLDTEPAHLLWQSGAVMAYQGTIVEEPVEKTRSVNVRLDVHRALVDSTWQKWRDG